MTENVKIVYYFKWKIEKKKKEQKEEKRTINFSGLIVSSSISIQKQFYRKFINNFLFLVFIFSPSFIFRHLLLFFSFVYFLLCRNF